MDAGDEFLAAEREALRLGVPCCCVDLDTAPRPNATMDPTDPFCDVPSKHHRCAKASNLNCEDVKFIADDVFQDVISVVRMPVNLFSEKNREST